MRTRPLTVGQLVVPGAAVLLSALLLAGPWVGPWPFASAAALALCGLAFTWPAHLHVVAAAVALGQVAVLGGALATHRPGAAAVGAWVGGGVAILLGWLLARQLATRWQRLEADVLRERARAAAVTTRDPLTGLLNERGLRTAAMPMMESTRRTGGAFHCAVLDVGGLAAVNARLGREGGDEVLLSVAESVSASVRAADVVARYDSDEFVVVGPGTGMQPGELVRRVRSRVMAAPPVSRTVWSAQVAVGCAVLEPWDGADLDALVRKARADLAVRRALVGPAAAEPARPAFW